MILLCFVEDLVNSVFAIFLDFKDEQYVPHQKLRVSQVFAKGRVRVAASYKTPAMLLI
jgi:hypothetical protein